jgi:hypothetical protein
MIVSEKTSELFEKWGFIPAILNHFKEKIIVQSKEAKKEAGEKKKNHF